MWDESRGTEFFRCYLRTKGRLRHAQIKLSRASELMTQDEKQTGDLLARMHFCRRNSYDLQAEEIRITAETRLNAVNPRRLETLFVYMTNRVISSACYAVFAAMGKRPRSLLPCRSFTIDDCSADDSTTVGEELLSLMKQTYDPRVDRIREKIIKPRLDAS